ncbi:unnamed protein product [Protopolystoma xenopodis]|uniref:Uncharacterized protein n=1 Tax=Protopolystoma xenopodis TaxID=117903 RepID=A0A3S5CBY8_9PLAT|nr:unnamed protein product [Protopolystoma xenopodis]
MICLTRGATNQRTHAQLTITFGLGGIGNLRDNRMKRFRTGEGKRFIFTPVVPNHARYFVSENEGEWDGDEKEHN